MFPVDLLENLWSRVSLIRIEEIWRWLESLCYSLNYANDYCYKGYFSPGEERKKIIIYTKDIRWIQIMHEQAAKQTQSEQEKQTNWQMNKRNK